ncbi:MAG: hypothetical protein M3N32_10515, partial [Actinomycetota bacterium]|nr:hypothetical protein [Actinomycetota bacterium]
DTAFEGGLERGDPFPDFELRTVSRRRVHKADYVGDRPLFMVCGSITCPMTMSAGPALRRLYDEYGDRVAFLTLYVGEANPVDRYRQPDTYEQKLAHARDYQYRERVPWLVAVDDLDAALQRALGAKTSASYIMAPDGTVAFRTSRTNDERLLREALSAIAAGHSPKVWGRQLHPGPMGGATRRLGHMETEVGDQAKADLHRTTTPVFGRLTTAFQSLPAPARGAVGLAAGLLPLVVAAVAIKVFVRRVDPGPQPVPAPGLHAAMKWRHQGGIHDQGVSTARFAPGDV